VGDFPGLTRNYDELQDFYVKKKTFSVLKRRLPHAGIPPAGNFQEKQLFVRFTVHTTILQPGRDPENVPWLIQKGTQWSAKDLETFNVEIKNGQVFVDVVKSQ
jgi:hypothetical protein